MIDAKKENERMTQAVKEKILLSINEKTRHEVPHCLLIDATNDIEKIIDKEISDVMVNVCEFGEMLESFGLEIVSKA